MFNRLNKKKPLQPPFKTNHRTLDESQPELSIRAAEVLALCVRVRDELRLWWRNVAMDD